MMKIRVVVPISGGKDSQACLKLARDNYPASEVRGLFCDTQFEHPLTYEHVDWVGAKYGIQIDKINDGDVLARCEQFGRFPSGISRHCTDYLKIRPTKRYLKALAEQQASGFEVWYGMRSAESPDRAERYAGKIGDDLYPPHEVMPSKYPKYLEKLGVMFRLAVLAWSDDDVMAFLDGELNPLYAHFDRVGCFPCLASGPRVKRKAFNHDDFGRQQYKKVMMVAERIGKDPFTGKPTPGCGVCAI